MTAVTLAFLAIYSFYRSRRVIDLMTEPHGHFTPILRTSHTVLELMPDTPEGEVKASETSDSLDDDALDDDIVEPRTGTG